MHSFFFLILSIFYISLSFWGKVWRYFLPGDRFCPCNSPSVAAAQGGKAWYAVNIFILPGKRSFICNVILTCLFLSPVSQSSTYCALCFFFSSFYIFPLTPAGEWGIIYGGKRNINLDPYEILCATISNSASIHLSYLVIAAGEEGRATERGSEIRPHSNKAELTTLLLLAHHSSSPLFLSPCIYQGPQGADGKAGHKV